MTRQSESISDDKRGEHEWFVRLDSISLAKQIHASLLSKKQDDARATGRRNLSLWTPIVSDARLPVTQRRLRLISEWRQHFDDVRRGIASHHGVLARHLFITERVLFIFSLCFFTFINKQVYSNTLESSIFRPRLRFEWIRYSMWKW